MTTLQDLEQQLIKHMPYTGGSAPGYTDPNPTYIPPASSTPSTGSSGGTFMGYSVGSSQMDFGIDQFNTQTDFNYTPSTGVQYRPSTVRNSGLGGSSLSNMGLYQEMRTPATDQYIMALGAPPMDPLVQMGMNVLSPEPTVGPTRLALADQLTLNMFEANKEQGLGSTQMLQEQAGILGYKEVGKIPSLVQSAYAQDDVPEATGLTTVDPVEKTPRSYDDSAKVPTAAGSMTNSQLTDEDNKSREKFKAAGYSDGTINGMDTDTGALTTAYNSSLDPAIIRIEAAREVEVVQAGRKRGAVAIPSIEARTAHAKLVAARAERTVAARRKTPPVTEETIKAEFGPGATPELAGPFVNAMNDVTTVLGLLNPITAPGALVVEVAREGAATESVFDALNIAGDAIEDFSMGVVDFYHRKLKPKTMTKKAGEQYVADYNATRGRAASVIAEGEIQPDVPAMLNKVTTEALEQFQADYDEVAPGVARDQITDVVLGKTNATPEETEATQTLIASTLKLREGEQQLVDGISAAVNAKAAQPDSEVEIYGWTIGPNGKLVKDNSVAADPKRTNDDARQTVIDGLRGDMSEVEFLRKPRNKKRVEAGVKGLVSSTNGETTYATRLVKDASGNVTTETITADGSQNTLVEKEHLEDLLATNETNIKDLNDKMVTALAGKTEAEIADMEDTELKEMYKEAAQLETSRKTLDKAIKEDSVNLTTGQNDHIPSLPSDISSTFAKNVKKEIKKVSGGVAENQAEEVVSGSLLGEIDNAVRDGKGKGGGKEDADKDFNTLAGEAIDAKMAGMGFEGSKAEKGIATAVRGEFGRMLSEQTRIRNKIANSRSEQERSALEAQYREVTREYEARIGTMTSNWKSPGFIWDDTIGGKDVHWGNVMIGISFGLQMYQMFYKDDEDKEDERQWQLDLYQKQLDMQDASYQNRWDTRNPGTTGGGDDTSSSGGVNYGTSGTQLGAI